MKALIVPQNNGRVAETHATGFEVAAPLYWVDCPKEVTAGWSYVDGVFTPPDLSGTYKLNRAAEYPSIGDQLDALWKGGDAATAMLAQVQAVKNKYPKG